VRPLLLLHLAWLWLMSPANLDAVVVPDQVIKGICAVESGCSWDAGQISGHYSISETGDVSPFQLSPAVLHQLGYRRLGYVHAHPELAERLARKWLSHLYVVTGSWNKAVAAYHVGMHGNRSVGRAYAARVLAAGLP
jgi:hypothetical protein